MLSVPRLPPEKLLRRLTKPGWGCKATTALPSESSKLARFQGLSLMPKAWNLMMDI